jgi:hypothetical protein
MLWAARLAEKDSAETMVRDTSAIGLHVPRRPGIFAYRRRADGEGYEPVELPFTAGVEISA